MSIPKKNTHIGAKKSKKTSHTMGATLEEGATRIEECLSKRGHDDAKLMDTPQDDYKELFTDQDYRLDRFVALEEGTAYTSGKVCTRVPGCAKAHRPHRRDCNTMVTKKDSNYCKAPRTKEDKSTSRITPNKQVCTPTSREYANYRTQAATFNLTERTILARYQRAKRNTRVYAFAASHFYTDAPPPPTSSNYTNHRTYRRRARLRALARIHSARQDRAALRNTTRPPQSHSHKLSHASTNQTMASAFPQEDTPESTTNPPAAKREKPSKDQEEASHTKKEVPPFDISALECPVCHQTPRQAPIFGCLNGHIICDTCRPKVSSCPLCRTGTISCRQRFAEQYVQYARDIGRHFPCTNAPACTHTAPIPELSDHEKTCKFTPFPCPGHHRGACLFMGSPTAILQHAVDNRCVIVSRLNPACGYKNTLLDSDENSVFGRDNATSHWRPVLAVSQKHMPLFAYLLIKREGHPTKPMWYFHIRSLAPKSIRDTAMVRLIISPPPHTEEEKESAKAIQTSSNQSTSNIASANSQDNGPSNTTPELTKLPVSMHMMVSPLVPHDTTDEQLKASGHYMALTDGQVKSLGRGTMLFAYSFELLHTKSQPSTQGPPEPSNNPTKETTNSNC